MDKNNLKSPRTSTKQSLNSMAQQTVIHELSKRGFQAVKHGRWEILIDNKISAKVHAKRGRNGPALRGLQGRDLLILVDYERSKPDFFILNIDDWKRVAENHI